jgi:DNA-binding XRE family transcriptional regulator
MLLTRRSPTVRRRRLGMELRRLREAAGLTTDRVAQILECSDSKISRIETGQVRATPETSGTCWRSMASRTSSAKPSSRSPGKPGRRAGGQAYSGTLIVSLVGLEAAAASIRSYETLLVPGLFQTTEYAGTIICTVRADLRPEEVQQWVELRMAR